jgi:hypothetical protein
VRTVVEEHVAGLERFERLEAGELDGPLDHAPRAREAREQECVRMRLDHRHVAVPFVGEHAARQYIARMTAAHLDHAARRELANESVIRVRISQGERVRVPDQITGPLEYAGRNVVEVLRVAGKTPHQFLLGVEIEEHVRRPARTKPQLRVRTEEFEVV